MLDINIYEPGVGYEPSQYVNVHGGDGTLEITLHTCNGEFALLGLNLMQAFLLANAFEIPVALTGDLSDEQRST